jgi:hypothetical protein
MRPRIGHLLPVSGAARMPHLPSCFQRLQSLDLPREANFHPNAVEGAAGINVWEAGAGAVVLINTRKTLQASDIWHRFGQKSQC